ncbi:MAG: hypothetical protein ACK4UN_19215 [Limisphaerales bacterium]
MHFRTIVLFSIGLNLVLGVGWAVYYFNNSVYSRRPIIRQAAGASIEQPTNAAATFRPVKFDWQSVESEDYATYIQNLRSINVPEDTIRDIILADVNREFAERRRMQALTNDFAWWRSESENAQYSQRQEKLQTLDRERRMLLNDLLGPDWEAREIVPDPAVDSGVYLGGPVLGNLSEKSKETVYEIAARARSRIESYTDSQRFVGQPVDPVELANLRREMRRELAQVLNPLQLEEFLLRYSETAEAMRRDLNGLEVTPSEFRSLFRMRDPLEQELSLLGGTDNAAAAGRIRALQNQMDTSILQVLGPERYIEYRLNEDPAFQETQSIAAQLGATPETVFSIYEITQEALEEQQRIQADPSLTAEERIDALASVQAEQQKALQSLLGWDGFRRWQQLQQQSR